MTLRRTLTATAVALLVTVPSTGCAAGSGPAEPTGSPASPAVSLPAENPGPGDHYLAIAIGGEARQYVVHAPPTYPAAGSYPLVLAFHGNPSTPSQLATGSQLNPVADRHGFLAVYPGRSGRWSAAEDMDFVRQLIEHLRQRWSVDPKRIYATGFSAGGEFSYHVAAGLPDTIAAFAPVSGAAVDLVIDRPQPMMTIQGGRDSLRGPAFVTANQQWRASGGCGPETVTTVTLGGPAERRASTCTKSGEHVIYHATEMGHEWPTEASALIWDFFAQHAKP